MAEDWRQDPFVDPEDPAARERAERRAEREEKRRKREAKRKGKEAAKAPAPEPAAPPQPPRTPEQEFWDEDPTPPPEAAEQEPAEPKPADTKPAEPKSPPPEPRDPAPPPEPEPEPEPEPAPTPPPEPAVEQSWDREPPSTPDPDIWGDEGDPELAAEGAQEARRRRGGRDRGAGGGGVLGALRRHPFRIAGVAIALIVAWFLVSLFQPFHGDGSGQVQVKIPKGSSVSEVGDLLGEKGVIDSSTMFQVRVTLAGKRSELYAGNFTLAEGMSYGAAIEALSTPPERRTLTVTIPEGYSRRQAAQLVEEDGVPGSYTKKTVKSRFLDPADYGGKKAKNLEGFLFPNTFELKPKAPVGDLVELQLKDFKRQIKKVNMKYAKSKNLTVFDVLIIASMIEDEAGVPKQRKLVSSVIYNRLREGIPLGIDATIRFATKNYTKPLTESELAVDSPYNTRANQGLPPGPINSPGIEAIQAAAHPAQTGFIYYVNKPNTCGVLAFAKTDKEFEADVAAYNKAREANGGNEPTTCGE